MTDSVQRDAAVAASILIQKAVRLELGCMAYSFAADPVESDLIQVYELWADAATLTAHFVEYPNFQSMLDILQQFGVKSAVSRKHRIDVSAPVYGPDSKPTADFDIPEQTE
jgi:quinol monooxygenase YgiN